MSSYATLLAPARGYGLARGSGPRGRCSVVVPVVSPVCTLVPKWTGGAAPSPKLQSSTGKKACCTKAGGSSFPDPEEWIDFSKPVPSSEPSRWVEPSDHTQVTAHEILVWCIEDAQDLMRKTPPPPLPGCDLNKLISDYEKLSKCAEIEAIEIFAATDSFLKLQIKTWQSYGEIVKGFKMEAVVDVSRAVSAACVDHVIRHRLLSRFGLEMDNMPEEPIDHDMAAAVMYSADLTRDVIGRFRRKVKKIQDRRLQRENERKSMEEEEDTEDRHLGHGI